MALKDAEARLRTVTGECRVVPDGEDVTEYDAWRESILKATSAVTTVA